MKPRRGGRSRRPETWGEAELSSPRNRAAPATPTPTARHPRGWPTSSLTSAPSVPESSPVDGERSPLMTGFSARMMPVVVLLLAAPMQAPAQAQAQRFPAFDPERIFMLGDADLDGRLSLD